MKVIKFSFNKLTIGRNFSNLRKSWIVRNDYDDVRFKYSYYLDDLVVFFI